jgi:hypothetical protein
MADWKIIGLYGLFNAGISILSVLIFYPLVVLGPLAGGFLAVYYSGSYEGYYGGMDRKDAAIIGVLTGIIGGLIAGLILVFATETVGIWVGLLNTKLGALFNSILAGYLIIQIIVVVNMVFGALGGLIGYRAK